MKDQGKGANQVTLTREETQGLVLRPGDSSASPALQQADLLWGFAASRARQLPASHQGGTGQWRWRWDNTQELQI